MPALNTYIGRAMKLRAHLFGHIHEQGGRVEDVEVGLPFSEDVKTVKFSNAATKFNVIDL
jgi:hypothetical protein